MKLYHYTNGNKIQKIIQSGKILTTPDKPKPREKPVAWLSSNPHWEKTANKIIHKDGEARLLNQKETEFYCKGLFRIIIDTENFQQDIFQWPRLGVEARIPQNLKKRLLSRAKKAGVNPSQWFGTLEPISIQNLKVEIYQDGNWQEVTQLEAKPIENGLNVFDAGSSMKVSAKNSDWNNI